MNFKMEQKHSNYLSKLTVNRNYKFCFPIPIVFA